MHDGCFHSWPRAFIDRIQTHKLKRGKVFVCYIQPICLTHLEKDIPIICFATITLHCQPTSIRNEMTNNSWMDLVVVASLRDC